MREDLPQPVVFETLNNQKKYDGKNQRLTLHILNNNSRSVFVLSFTQYGMFNQISLLFKITEIAQV